MGINLNTKTKFPTYSLKQLQYVLHKQDVRLNWAQLAQDWIQWWAVVSTVLNLHFA